MQAARPAMEADGWDVARERLRAVLQEAQPSWTEKSVFVAQEKLAQIGVDSADVLAEALKENLNDRLREAGLKAFSAETLRGLRAALAVQSRARAGRGSFSQKLKSAPAPEPDGGEDLYQEFFKLVDTPSTASTTSERTPQRHPPPVTPRATVEPVEELPDYVGLDVAADTDVKGSMDVFTRYSDEELRQECERRCLPAGDRPKEQLLEALREDSVWQRLGTPKLRQVCSERGLFVPERGPGVDERASLLTLLADDRWQQLGIPIARLKRRDDAQALLVEVLRLERLQLGQLVTECRRLKIPAKPTIGRKKLAGLLKKHHVWRFLSPSELMAECRNCGGMDPSPTAQSEQLLQELHRSTHIEEWEALGIPAKRFGDLRAAEDIARELGVMKEKADAHLKADCMRLGIPLDPYVQRQEILRRLLCQAIWQRMPIAELEKECILLGLPSLPSAFRGGSSKAREQLVGRLLNHACMTTWKVLGIPAEHLTVQAAMHVADVFEYLDGAGEGELREKYQEHFLDERMERSEVVERLKLVVLWQELPCSALRDECGTKGIRLDESEKALGDDDDDKEELRELLMGKLLLHERARRWKSQGFPTDRLHNEEAAVELHTRQRELEAMSGEEILKEYKALGLPEEESMGRTAMLVVLKQRALWWALSWPELIRECERRDISVEHFKEKDGDEEELWTDFSGELLKRLLEFECMSMWEMRGFPIQRLRSFDTAVLLVERYEQIAKASLEDLRQECKAMNLPTPPEADRAVLARYLRIRALWRGLSMLELSNECTLRDLTTHDILLDEGEAPRSELWKRGQLVRRLSNYECLVAWEEQGFQALRIGNVEAVSALAARYGELEAMGDGELRAACLERGLPEEELLERPAMLQSLRQVLEWEAMPVQELQKDCQEREMPAATWNGGDQEALVELLLMDLYESVYERKGIPAKSLSSLKAAMALSRRWEELKTMEPSQLLSECTGMGMIPGVKTPSTLRERLRKVALWEELGFEQLRKEASTLGAAAEGASTPAALRDMLILNLCSQDFSQIGVPVHRLRSMQAAITLEKKMRQVKDLSMEQLRQDCLAKRVPTAAIASRQDLLELVSNLTLWEELPPEELRAECQNAGIPHQQTVPQSLGQDEQRKMLKELLLTRACQPALHERGIYGDEVAGAAACFAVVEAWDKLGAMTEAALQQEYRGFGVPLKGVPSGEVLLRLRQIAVWMEAPLTSIQKECRKACINSIARENEKADLVRKLVKALWGELSPEEQRQRQQKEQQRRDEEQRRQDRQQQQQQQQKPRSRAGPASSDAQRMQLAAHLRTLGLSMPLNIQDVRKSYKRLALKYHPDKNSETDKEHAAEMFLNVSDAYKFIVEHAKTAPSVGADDPGDAVLAASFLLVGSWSDWTSAVELVADSSGGYSADVEVDSGAEIEFQVLCDGKWDRRLYPNLKGDLVLGPASDEAHGMNWRLPPQRDKATLRVKLRPRARKLEYFVR